MKKYLVTTIGAVLILLACSKSSDNNTPPPPTPVDCSGAAKSFATDVAPIIQSSCATNSDCHATGSTNGPGPLTTYAQVFNARPQIRSAVASGLMPKNGSLTATQKSAIICWIDAGAPNN